MMTDVVDTPRTPLQAPAREPQVAVRPGPPMARPESVSWLKDALETLLLTLVLFLVINVFTVRYEVQSVSMEPTLHEGQYLIIFKLAYRLHPPERGDIIVLHPPNSAEDAIPYIKRLMGLPGDHIEIHDGRVWINGQALNEPYISGPPTYTGSWVLGADQYFVLGDNRNNSSDSHAWGAITEEDIIGKAIFRYWPLRKIGPFPHYTYDFNGE